MAEPGARAEGPGGPYPFGLPAAALLELGAAAWIAHDGQWFLKVAARHGLEEAMRLNEQALASLARIELREFRRVSGLGSLDTVAEVAEWYRLARLLFGGPRIPPVVVTVLDEDTLVVENRPCLGEPIAARSGYAHLAPGTYPPCRGWLARQRAWGEALSTRYRYTVERAPVEGQPCRYVVRRVRRDA